MKKLGIFVCAASILIGYGGNPHPKIVSFTPASVVIDYSKMIFMKQLAWLSSFVLQLRKMLNMLSTKESGWTSSEKLAFFNCIERGKTVAGWAASHGAANNTHTPIINNFK